MKKYKHDAEKVIEVQTGYIIQRCASKEAAKKIAGRLNGGNGFQGESPRFFINTVNQGN